MTRTGKIARLPNEIRDQLNCRLRDGEQGQKLAAWLNTLPEAQTVLATEFASQSITPQNLSEWKKGGYKDWLLQQEALAMIQTITADTDALKAASPDPLTDKLALWLVARYAVAAKSLKGADDWQRLRELCFDLVLLRKGDHSAERLRLEREKMEHDREELRELREEEFEAWAREHRDDICGSYKTPEEKMDILRRRIFGMAPAEPKASHDDKPLDCECPEPTPTKSGPIQSDHIT